METFFTSAKALHFVIEHCIGKESAFLLLTLLACHLFLHLTKLLAALLQPECAGSLSCSDHVSIGQHWIMWGGREGGHWRESGIGAGQTGSGRGDYCGMGSLAVQENGALLIGALCI